MADIIVVKLRAEDVDSLFDLLQAVSHLPVIGDRELVLHIKASANLARQTLKQNYNMPVIPTGRSEAHFEKRSSMAVDRMNERLRPWNLKGRIAAVEDSMKAAKEKLKSFEHGIDETLLLSKTLDAAEKDMLKIVEVAGRKRNADEISA